jgi:hypothetical protein
MTLEKGPMSLEEEPYHPNKTLVLPNHYSSPIR